MEKVQNELGAINGASQDSTMTASSTPEPESESAEPSPLCEEKLCCRDEMEPMQNVRRKRAKTEAGEDDCGMDDGCRKRKCVAGS